MCKWFVVLIAAAAVFSQLSAPAGAQLSIDEPPPPPPFSMYFPTETELAGNSLGDFPHFEYVAAINEGSPVTFALDPTRFPANARALVDLYIVDDRSRTQWLSDRTLSDVRGAPQRVRLGANNIQSCTVVLTNSDTLSGDAGIGLGVGYDLVCDVNRNGRLDGNDLIDGFEGAAGFYVVHDLTQPGPLAVTETIYDVAVGTVTGGFEGENLFYPTNVSLMDRLPLIVVSHGNGHQYEWYDHIGLHMASYGYIVMSHQNNTVPGVQTAATTTLEHTDAFLGQLASIAGGILVGHVDTSRIVWIGHSRGGEGVAIAYDRIVDGIWSPVHYKREDIVLISSIAPVDFDGPASTNPHDAVFSLWTGGSDNDVSGCASADLLQTFHLHDRAEKWRQSISLHGVGHGDFHNGGGSSVATGPCLVGRADTHEIMRGYLLPLVKHYVERNLPARDYLWRQWESFQPIGAPTANPCVTVDLMFREDPALSFPVDDFQTEPTTGTSSSGGSVTFSVTDVSEGLLDDGNSDFTNDFADVMNGMTVGSAADTTRGIVFSWGSDSFYEQEIIPAERDLTDDVYLSFRACQATRHPNTIAQLGDLTFTVTLVDGALNESSIRIDAYGGGIEEPYARSGCGTGTGWGNEFETIRIRLTDFLNNGSSLDLSDVAAIRFDFGPSFGSSLGRLGLDEITISRDASPPLTGVLTLALLDDLTVIPPDVTTDIHVSITASSESLVPGSATMHYRFNGGVFATPPLIATGMPGEYSATLPAPSCGDTPEIYFSAEGSLSGQQTLPEDAPSSVFSSLVGNLSVNFADDFENDQGWTAENLGATTGDWQRGVPVNDPGWAYDPAADGDGSGSCYLTQNQVGNTDVDNGSVRLNSPTFDATGDLVLIQYFYFLRLTNTDGTDRLLVEYSSNGAAGPWTTLVAHQTDGGLQWRSHLITHEDILNAGASLSATARIRFTANDTGTQSIVEAGVDGFTVETAQCSE